MKLKKFIAIMATVGMVASMAVGCGGSSEEDTSAEGTDAAAEGEASGDWDSSMDITIVSREDGSGTRGAFIELFGIEEEVFSKISKKDLYSRAGTQFLLLNTIYQFAALKKYRPELLAQADKVLLMPDLFAYFLTGKIIDTLIFPLVSARNPYTAIGAVFRRYSPQKRRPSHYLHINPLAVFPSHIQSDAGRLHAQRTVSLKAFRLLRIRLLRYCHLVGLYRGKYRTG